MENKAYCIWIDKNIDNKENTQYSKEIKLIGLLKF